MLRRFTQSAAAFLNRDSGPTAVECTVMVAMILMAILTAISTLEQTRAGS
jgi:Flp pilus assembly pilin Flp